MPDKRFLLVKVNSRNNPLFVAADIKDVKITHFVYGVERQFYVGKAQKKGETQRFSSKPAAVDPRHGGLPRRQ